MTSNTPQTALAPTYRKALKTWRPVILYFGNQHCPACEEAGPVFRAIAEAFRHRADVYMLSTRESPRHPEVTGTPTVLFYKDGKLVKKLKGIGSPQSLAEDFVAHVGKVKPRQVARKPGHDRAWLRRTLRSLCMVPRARSLVGA
ncbi:thioredoxin family protein [Pseudomonas sp. ADAK2]|uniref:thioredoxin family protein n=1 Tax=Pseudomonas TaxID=286 RepID=UPI0014646853|nr:MULTISPECIES: thioredoxin family protein [unclassified Pseudomonas]QJI39854.1 thioredoxin family protein [Pseudomonas sp. ADAK7]QJI46160.1 thioredoxin family protein [Pseudomonas sp. ADAK2]